jgi:cytochrome c oxidase assembly protein subunit 15
MVLIAFTYWFALSLLVKPEDRVYHPKLRRFSLVLIVLLVVQLGYGAFMAGLKAATVAPTWPDINGDILPANWLSLHYVNHPIAIHIIHRMLAYLLLTLSAIWTYKMYAIPANTYFAKYRLIPMLFIVLQVILGIVTVINAQHLTRNGMGIFENLALLHQLCGMCLAMSFVWALYVLSPKSEN